jgi:hypothetical protein
MAEQPRAHESRRTRRSRATAWAAYAACALALLYAVPSFYWALGGTTGLDTVGGAIEELAAPMTLPASRWASALAP